MEIISYRTSTKQDRQELANLLLQRIYQGIENPLQVHVKLKELEDLIKQIMSNKDYKDMLLTEGSKHGKSFTFAGNECKVMETGVKYDYSVCNDPDWNQLDADINNLKEKQKERETFLKTIRPCGLNIFDEETGETYELNPPVKTSSTTISITLK